MQYDGQGRLVQVTSGGNTARYDYDGEGRRVRKTEMGGSPVSTVYVHDAGGNLIAEYNTQGSTTETGTRYLTADHLGSTRLVTDGSRVVVQRLDYFPFGQTIPAGMTKPAPITERSPMSKWLPYLLVAALAEFAQAFPQGNQAPFSISISAAKNVFKAGSEVRIRLVFKNTSGEEIPYERGLGTGVEPHGRSLQMLRCATQKAR